MLAASSRVVSQLILSSLGATHIHCCVYSINAYVLRLYYFFYFFYFFTSVAFNDIVYGVCHLRMSMHTTLMSFVCQMFVFVLCLGVGLVLTVVM